MSQRFGEIQGPTDSEALEKCVGLRSSTAADLDRLAAMNRELIEDEGHRNPMTVPELKQRFQQFLARDGYSVDVITVDGAIAGFATHRYEPDNAEPSGFRVFLRQFYICREKRGAGIGSLALACLIKHRFKPGDRIFLDVLETNPDGKRFWARGGFTPYHTTMELLVRSESAQEP